MINLSSKLVSTFGILTLMVISSMAVAGPAHAVLQPPFGRMGADLSILFQSLMVAPSHNSANPVITGAAASPIFALPPKLVTALRRYKIVIVPGLKTEAMGRKSGDFVDEMTALRDSSLVEGPDFMMMSSAQHFNGLQRASMNSEAVANVIRNSERPVLLITQSKGSVDALEAFINDPQLMSKTHAWFSIQGALWGSCIADSIEASWTDRSLFHRAVQLLGGDPQAIVELQRTSRYAYMMTHETQVAKVARQMKVISFASWKDFSELWWPLQKLDAAYFPDYQTIQSDGVVQLSDALLPNSDYVVAPQVDHADTTLQTQKQKSASLSLPLGFDRKAFMRAILTLMLQ